MKATTKQCTSCQCNSMQLCGGSGGDVWSRYKKERREGIYHEDRGRQMGTSGSQESRVEVGKSHAESKIKNESVLQGGLPVKMRLHL